MRKIKTCNWIVLKWDSFPNVVEFAKDICIFTTVLRKRDNYFLKEQRSFFSKHPNHKVLNKTRHTELTARQLAEGIVDDRVVHRIQQSYDNVFQTKLSGVIVIQKTEADTAIFGINVWVIYLRTGNRRHTKRHDNI